MKYFEANLREIESSPVLRVYGALLATTHLWTVLFFWNALSAGDAFGRELMVYLRPEGHPTCWPGSQFCGWASRAPTWAVGAIFALYVVAALGAAWGYLRPSSFARAHVVNAVLFVAKFAFLIGSAPLLPNYHYVLLIVATIYFLLPRKLPALQVAVVLVYMAAGVLKWGPEWLSGAALTEPVPEMVPLGLVNFSLRAVVVMECFAVLGLLARSASIRWFAFVWVVIFHLVSIQQVGLFYPLIMLSELALFPLIWWREPERIGKALAGLWTPQPAWPALAFLTIFVFAQAYPHLVSPDPAITGEARYVAVNMLDARPICYSQMILKFANRRWVELGGDFEALRTRTLRSRCDPLRFFNLARRQCRAMRTNPEFEDLDLALVSKRSTDRNFHRVVSLSEFCARPARFNYLTHNSWMTWETE